jgi:hypothetical protein
VSPDDLEALFARLLLVYGAGKLDQIYRGQPIELVRRAWAHELRALSTSDVAYGMTMLPADFCPNVLQFKAIALRAPQKPLKALDTPPVDPVHRARVVAALKALEAELRARKSPVAWAVALKAREAANERLTMFQRCAWREALGPQPGE